LRPFSLILFWGPRVAVCWSVDRVQFPAVASQNCDRKS
jgi:hypothetical protein